MGRPYEREIELLVPTYDWAITTNLHELTTALRGVFDAPLISVGSGGSLSAAHFISTLHERYSGLLATALTPLDLVGTSRRLDRTGVIFVSAGGSNPDIVDALDLTVAQEPLEAIVLTGRVDGALAKTSREWGRVRLVAPLLPVRKDGYLATNSLLSFALLAWRGYASLIGDGASIPPRLSQLLGADLPDYRQAISVAMRDVIDRDSFVLLHGPETRAAALDLESRCVEAGIAPLWTADYRNFAHGRHQWLARFGEKLGVILLETDRDEELAESTRALLPAELPTARLRLKGKDSAAGLAGLVTSIIVAAELGQARGVDPGRPRVPSYGRRLYRLKGLRSVAPEVTRGTPTARRNLLWWAAIRKERASMARVTASPALEWCDLAEKAACWLESQPLAGVVFDYDGTLCAPVDRFTGVSSPVVPGIRSLIEAGVPLGIATGRGGSAVEALRSVIDRKHWPKVTVGLYNGAVVQQLSDTVRLDSSHPRAELDPVRDALETDPRLTEIGKITAREYQITVELAAPARERELWDLVTEVVARMSPWKSLRVLRSSHSVDVLSTISSKLAVVNRLAEGLKGGRVLRIGDRGRYPGNDFELLHSPFGLSVDEVSSDRDTCWNFSPRGMKGIEGSAFYLSAMRPVGGGLFKIRF